MKNNTNSSSDKFENINYSDVVINELQQILIKDSDYSIDYTKGYKYFQINAEHFLNVDFIIYMKKNIDLNDKGNILNDPIVGGALVLMYNQYLSEGQEKGDCDVFKSLKGFGEKLIDKKTTTDSYFGNRLDTFTSKSFKNYVYEEFFLKDFPEDNLLSFPEFRADLIRNFILNSDEHAKYMKKNGPHREEKLTDEEKKHKIYEKDSVLKSKNKRISELEKQLIAEKLSGTINKIVYNSFAKRSEKIKQNTRDGVNWLIDQKNNIIFSLQEELKTAKQKIINLEFKLEEKEVIIKKRNHKIVELERKINYRDGKILDESA